MRLLSVSCLDSILDSQSIFKDEESRIKSPKFAEVINHKSQQGIIEESE